MILEALRCDYRWANDRLHQFVIDGMAEHARALADTPVHYVPYIEPSRGAGKGLLAALGRDACLVVTDDFPCFFLPQMSAAAARQLDVRLEAVDSNGLLPMRAAERTAVTAFSFRAHVQRQFRDAIKDWPQPIDFADLPVATGLTTAVEERWRPAAAAALENAASLIAALPIDHRIAPAATRGGSAEGRRALARFVDAALVRYAADHNQPDTHGTSRLSPYLHFGHLSAHEVFAAVMTAEKWTTRKLGAHAGGKRDGWWGVRPGAEAFLDQLVTWRELGLNMCVNRPDDYHRYESLPLWARTSLDRHRLDTRQFVYSLDEFESAQTHDVVWNAAQRQLTREGWMHNYLRMLWGKKILEWTRSPEDAIAVMTEVMNKHALDGRDPNSYSGYFWTLGRYDRPWAPERPVYGTVRYMSSANTTKKLRMKTFLEDYGA